LELQSKHRSRVKVAVFCVLAVNVIGLTALLMQGCKREQNEAEQAPLETTNEAAMLNSNLPPEVASNPPTTAAQPLAVPETAGTEYVIVKGDSLWKIAKHYGVTVKAIEAANPGVDPAKLKVGQKLSIPGGAASATDMAGSSGAGGGMEIYTVKSGDSLTRIAQHYGVTVRAIESENGLSTTRITVGQKLKIPAKTEAAPAAAPVPAAAPPTTSTAPATDTSTTGSQ
jgi:LysM repeat protein